MLWIPLAGERLPPGTAGLERRRTGAGYVRIAPGPDGASHFEDVPVALTARSEIVDVSAPVSVTGVIFRRSPPDYDLDWHQAPRRQFVITLSGAVEIVASDGEARRLGVGSAMLAEDTTGKGHLSRAPAAVERRSLFVPLA